MGLALKNFAFLAVVVDSVGKAGKSRGHRTRLVRALNIERQMEALWHENDTRRVAINAVNSDRSIAARVTKESNVLVGVSKKSASES